MQHLPLLERLLNDKEHMIRRGVPKNWKVFPSKAPILTEKQDKTLQEIFNKLKEIDAALQPLREKDIEYTLSCAGGALRDLILNNTDKINDIDILVNITNYGKLYSSLDSDKTDELLTNSVNSLLNYPNKEVFFTSEDRVAEYESAYIAGLIKVKCQEGRPVDIIITKSQLQAIDFTDTFSFDICRASVFFKNQNNHLELLNSLEVSEAMLSDIKNKKLTVNLNNINEVQLNHFMKKHYLKMKEKYPEYKLDYRLNNFKKELPEKRALVSIIEYYTLQEKLGTKENTKRLKL